VKIDIHQQLYRWRQELVQQGYVPPSKSWAMKWLARVLGHPQRLARAGQRMRWLLRAMPALVQHRWNPWYRHRAMPTPPRISFKEWYQQNRA
jgi:L-lactate dehydrogenase complex protein LldF